MVSPIKVLVADDHNIVRHGLNNVLGAETDIKVIGEAEDGLDAINKACRLNPDVIILDIFMPKCTGLDALLSIKERLPGVKVLMLTISEREEDLFQAMRFGAQGYLLKSAHINEIVDAVRNTAAGEAMLSPQMLNRLVAEFREKLEEPRLSAREMEVLEMLGDGLSNVEIASRLFISESTVRSYLQRLLEKLHLKNRTEAVAYAIRHHPNGKPSRLN